MNSNEIFGKISENIITQLHSFKNNEISIKSINDSLILNISSLNKFMKDKNQSFDDFLPAKFKMSIESQLKSNPDIKKEKDEENYINKSTDEENGKEKDNNCNIKDNRTLNFDFNEGESVFNPNMDDEFDYKKDESIAGSLFSQNLPRMSVVSNIHQSQFLDIMDKT